jgi:hypothetical protein
MSEEDCGKHTMNETKKLREILGNLISALKNVHADPEYQAVWSLYQLHVSGGYKGRQYTKELDAAIDFLKEESPEEYDDATSTIEEQKEFEKGCLERFNMLCNKEGHDEGPV